MIDAVSSTSSAPAKPADDKHKQLVAAAQAFEAVFLRQMIGSMRQANLGEDILGSSAGKQFRDMQDARMADSMAATHSLGIADMLVAQFDKKGGAK